MQRTRRHVGVPSAHGSVDQLEAAHAVGDVVRRRGEHQLVGPGPVGEVTQATIDEFMAAAKAALENATEENHAVLSKTVGDIALVASELGLNA